MLLPAKCPECGGLIEVNSEQKAANCKFCGSAFIVEEAVNNFNTYFNVTNIYNTSHNYGDGAVVNVYEDKSKDFVIEGGVLKKYQGESVDVVIPDGVVEIGKECFKDLKIKSVTIPVSVTSICANAFYGCRSLNSVYINDLVAWCSVSGSPLSCLFAYAENLYFNGKLTTELVIPDGVTTIGIGVFAGCESLTSVTIPNSVTSIGASAFSNCKSLTSVTISDSVTSMGGFCFSGCTSLTSITLPDSVTNMGGSCFSGCTSLISITIPNSVTHIENRTFYGCTSLTSITIPRGVKNIDSVFSDYSSSCGAFADCTNLSSVTISNTATEIGWAAFYNTPYEKVKREAKEQAEKQRRIAEWKEKGLCQHCGGYFNGLFIKKCGRCGKEKDY